MEMHDLMQYRTRGPVRIKMKKENDRYDDELDSR